MEDERFMQKYQSSQSSQSKKFRNNLSAGLFDVGPLIEGLFPLALPVE